jgi:ABC-type transport system involved in multi-copper enzyme maturation permease subunit
VLLVFPIVIRIKPSKRNAVIAIGSTLLLAVFLFEILSLLGLRDHPYYQNAVQKGALSMIGLVDLLFMCIFLALCLWAKKFNQVASMSPIYFWVFLTAFCICLLAPVIYPISRINEYLWPFMIFQLLRYIDPAAMRQPCGQPDNKANSLLRIMVITLFAIKLIGINTIRPEWLHVDDYQFYDFSKTHHTYNLYPQE